MRKSMVSLLFAWAIGINPDLTSGEEVKNIRGCIFGLGGVV